MRKTLSFDNRTEFAQFKKLEMKVGVDVYFVRPYAPWQRGTNENTNGLLRQYFSKGINFQGVNDAEVTEAVQRLDYRPRKCLNYHTPHEVFWKEARGALAI
jgi:IS30 family transposase